MARHDAVAKAVLSLLQQSDRFMTKKCTHCNDTFYSAELSSLYVQLRGDTLVAGVNATANEANNTVLRRATTTLKALNNPMLLKRRTMPAMMKMHTVSWKRGNGASPFTTPVHPTNQRPTTISAKTNIGRARPLIVTPCLSRAKFCRVYVYNQLDIVLHFIGLPH